MASPRSSRTRPTAAPVAGASARASSASTWWATSASISIAPPARPASRERAGRILRPVVPRVAAAELLPHLGIRRAPEAREIVRDLHGPLVGREQLEDQRHAAAREARRRREAEHLLDACGDGGRALRRVSNARAPSARERIVDRRLARERGAGGR